MSPDKDARTVYDVLNQVAVFLALEAQESAKTSRDFGRGVSHAARIVADMRDNVFAK